MSVKERIILLRLLEMGKSRPEFLEEIGVAISVKEKNGNSEIKENSCSKEEKWYEKVHIKGDIRKS